MVVFGGIVCEREKGSGKEEEEYDIHIMCVRKPEPKKERKSSETDAISEIGK